MKVIGNQSNYQHAFHRLTEQQNTVLQEAGFKQKQIDQEESPEMQRIRQFMEDRKKETEAQASEQIAKKLARGEYITDAEREKLRASNPEKYQKSREANQKRIMIGKRLTRVKTKAEAAAILTSERSLAFSMVKNGEQELGELYLDAIHRAEVNFYQGKKTLGVPKDRSIEEHKYNLRI